MKIRLYESKTIVKLENVPFSKSAFLQLEKLATVAPNLKLEGTDFHTGKPVQVRLFQLEYDWAWVNRINIPYTVGA